MKTRAKHYFETATNLKKVAESEIGKKLISLYDKAQLSSVLLDADVIQKDFVRANRAERVRDMLLRVDEESPLFWIFLAVTIVLLIGDHDHLRIFLPIVIGSVVLFFTAFRLAPGWLIPRYTKRVDQYNRTAKHLDYVYGVYWELLRAYPNLSDPKQIVDDLDNQALEILKIETAYNYSGSKMSDNTNWDIREKRNKISSTTRCASYIGLTKGLDGHFARAQKNLQEMIGTGKFDLPLDYCI